MVRLGGVILYACAELIIKRPATRLDRALWLHKLCHRSLRTFGVQVSQVGTFPHGGVLISNHLSYLDIVVFASLGPCVFVSKSEVESWPVLGWMTTMAGTVYVERGRRASAKEAGSGMRRAAACGLPVVLFPEGTTSNGDSILKFHSGLLAEAVAHELPVTAAHLRYSLADGNPNRTVREDVAFWGDHAMLPHIFRYLGLRGVCAEVTLGSAPIYFPVRVGPGRLIANQAREAVLLLGEGCAASTAEVGAIR